MSSVAVDVSRFFVFEVTGDSSEVVSASVAVAEDFWADDDAQSCSCDTSDGAQSVRLFCGDDDGEEDRPGSSCCVENESEEDEEDGDEVNQSENRGVGPQQKQTESSSKVQGGSVELVNEKDRDRLFWEACLAS